MANRVMRYPTGPGSRGAGSFVSVDALITMFLLFCLASFLSFPPSLSRYVYLRVASSVRQSPALFEQTLYFEVRVPVSFVFCLVTILFFAFFLGWRLCRALVLGTLAFSICLRSTLIVSVLFVFCLTVCDHTICIFLG